MRSWVGFDVGVMFLFVGSGSGNHRPSRPKAKVTDQSLTPSFQIKEEARPGFPLRARVHALQQYLETS